MKLPLTARKKVLKSLFDFADPLRFTPHRNRHGEDYYKEACRKGWEGLIAKQKQSAYVCSRSKKWLKFKCVLQQEFVIGGFTEWTPDGKLRHPRFLGIRRDKAPEKVVREDKEASP